MVQSVVEVVAAVIERRDGSFLLARRPEGKVYAGYWEFPGGKVEAGESLGDALARELREELGIEVRHAVPWITRVHSYPHSIVRLNFHRVTQWQGEPQPHEGQSLTWQRFPDLTVEPMLPANAPVLKALRVPLVMGITHAWETGVAPALAAFENALTGGLRLVQVRESSLRADARLDFSRRLCNRLQGIGGIAVVNGDADLALELGAGLHLPSTALMEAKARPDFEWCGASCHDEIELARAADLQLDYVLLGPVRVTASHPHRPGMGWDQFAKLVRGYSLPVLALGGMRPSDVEVAREHGAHGIAMIRGAWGNSSA